MATTRREFTAHQRSENASDSVGSGPIPALGYGPHVSTAAESVRQAGIRFITSREDAIHLISWAVTNAYVSHKKTNGSTVSLIYGNMVGRKLFAVSIYPTGTVQLRKSPSWQEIFDFASENWERLLKPGHALGTWFDDKNLVHVLEIVVCTSDLTEAMTLGLNFDQTSIFDLEACQEIPIPRPSREVEGSAARSSNE